MLRKKESFLDLSKKPEENYLQTKKLGRIFNEASLPDYIENKFFHIIDLIFYQLREAGFSDDKKMAEIVTFLQSNAMFQLNGQGAAELTKAGRAKLNYREPLCGYIETFITLSLNYAFEAVFDEQMNFLPNVQEHFEKYFYDKDETEYVPESVKEYSAFISSASQYFSRSTRKTLLQNNPDPSSNCITVISKIEDNARGIERNPISLFDEFIYEKQHAARKKMLNARTIYVLRQVQLELFYSTSIKKRKPIFFDSMKLSSTMPNQTHKDTIYVSSTSNIRTILKSIHGYNYQLEATTPHNMDVFQKTVIDISRAIVKNPWWRSTGRQELYKKSFSLLSLDSAYILLRLNGKLRYEQYLDQPFGKEVNAILNNNKLTTDRKLQTLLVFLDDHSTMYYTNYSFIELKHYVLNQLTPSCDLSTPLIELVNQLKADAAGDVYAPSLDLLDRLFEEKMRFFSFEGMEERERVNYLTHLMKGVTFADAKEREGVLERLQKCMDETLYRGVGKQFFGDFAKAISNRYQLDYKVDRSERFDATKRQRFSRRF